MAREPEWTKQAYQSSITSTCFSSTPYDAGWDARSNIDGRILQADAQMRRLLELEAAVRPVRVWAQQVARQIEKLPPCGWCFPQAVEAICTNIGAGDPAAAAPAACYTVGPNRLRLMGRYAVCLDGWLKQAAPGAVAAQIEQQAFDQRDWAGIARKVWEVLGEPNSPKVLLVRRLLGRLRFWLRAPFGLLKSDDNPALGYFYTHAMGRYGGWDHFSFERRDPDVVELEERVRCEIDKADRWLELIDSTWPCAPKVFRYLERIICRIGQVEEDGDTSPAELDSPLPDGILQADAACLDSDGSRRLFDTAAAALREFVANDFPAASGDGADTDGEWAGRLACLLGEPSPERVWLAALLLKRIALFEGSFKTFHFTRNPQQA
jgi:hypothetical protein